MLTGIHHSFEYSISSILNKNFIEFIEVNNVVMYILLLLLLLRRINIKQDYSQLIYIWVIIIIILSMLIGQINIHQVVSQHVEFVLNNQQLF